VREEAGATATADAAPMPEIPLRHPQVVQGLAGTMPLALGVVFLIASYFPTFFAPALLFALLALPPFALSSLSLYVWARRRATAIGGMPERIDALDATIAGFAFAQVAGVLISVGHLFISLHVLLWGEVIGVRGYTLILVGYLLWFSGSFLIQGRLLQAEVDAESAKPKTRPGRLMRMSARLPGGPGLLAVLATPGLVFAILLREILPEPWQAAVLGAGSLALALMMIMMVPVGFRKWQYLRRLREAEFGGKD